MKMVDIIHSENKILLPLTGIIFIIAVIIVSIQHFAKVDFGLLGIIAWIIVIFGAIYFVCRVLSEIFGW